MSSKLLCFCLLMILFEVSVVNASYSICGNWQTYNDEKCIKIFDTEKLVSFDDALKACSQIDNSSQIITIHSKEEQDFMSEYLFKTQKLVDNVWIGLRNKTKSFEWIDSSNKPFTNWRTGNPTDQPDCNCVQFDPHSFQWTNEFCNKKNLVVCQKLPQTSDLLKNILELKERLTQTEEELKITKDKLTKTEEKLIKTEDDLKRSQNQTRESCNFILNKNISHYQLFTDVNGKTNAFIIPLSGLNHYTTHTFDDSVNLCKTFNSTIIEIESLEKQKIFESFLNKLGHEFLSKLWYFWINGIRDSFGKWKWLNSNKDMTFTNWQTGFPKTFSYGNNTIVGTRSDTFGKWYNYVNISNTIVYVMCEHTFGI